MEHAKTAEGGKNPGTKKGRYQSEEIPEKGKKKRGLQGKKSFSKKPGRLRGWGPLPGYIV